MKPHAQMERLIVNAASALYPALPSNLLDADGLVDDGILRLATMPMARALRTARGPASAVYITWDTHGTCRYVGSVHRPGARAAVRERLGEHLRIVERRGRWYAVTVLPVQTDLGLEVVHECEGIVARRLCPAEGSAHPVPSTERFLSDLVASQRAGLTDC